MTFDYRYYKERIHKLCRYLNQTFLMPQFSPFLEYAEDEAYYYFTFNYKKIPFLKEDVTLLPVTNITVEELSKWFVHELIQDKDELDRPSH
ncbi:6-pyruvoyl tetrahydrobiopterin synthase [Legionella sainthelensi]|nr:6-pyruvoyl tetrahydrobiopterin synthase [Legionella sainthelensi]